MEVKVVWVTADKNMSYDREKNYKMLHNFLFWKDGEKGLLIAGDAIYDDASHKNLLKRFEENGGKCNGMPIGAGNKTGFIMSWQSHGLNIQTPHNYKEIIALALGI